MKRKPLSEAHKQKVRLRAIEREAKRKLVKKLADAFRPAEQPAAVTVEDVLIESTAQPPDQPPAAPATASATNAKTQPTREDHALYLQVSERLRANWSVDLILHNLSISKDKLDKLCALYKTTLPELIARCQELGSRLIRLSVQRRAEAGDVRAVELLADLILKDQPKKDFTAGYTLAELKQLRDELKATLAFRKPVQDIIDGKHPTVRVLSPAELATPLQGTSKKPGLEAAITLPGSELSKEPNNVQELGANARNPVNMTEHYHSVIGSYDDEVTVESDCER